MNNKTQTFIDQARKVHGDRYTYDHTEATKADGKVNITCPKHGDVLVGYQNFLKGHGCNQCGNETTKAKLTGNTQDFVTAAVARYGDQYDYSGVDYYRAKSKVNIGCKVPGHGVFEKTPQKHLAGQGCPKCSLLNRSSVKTTRDFIEDATRVHGDRYTYNNSVYSSSRQPIEVTCRDHGAFYPTPNNFLRGSHCPRCSTVSDNTVEDTERFIARARIHRKDIDYDYSKVIYRGSKQPVTITCPNGHEFHPTPNNFLRAERPTGCPVCPAKSPDVSVKTAEFIARAKAARTDGEFDYSKVHYLSNKDKVTIGCPNGHAWDVAPNNFLRGSNCPGCSTKSMGAGVFKQKARAKHGDRYDYSKVVYNGTKVKVIITCPTHGDFEQVPGSHLSGKGCTECGRERMINKASKSNEQFIREATAIHGDHYDYSRVKYVRGDVKVTIGCPVHSWFEQEPHGHLKGNGCQLCARTSNGLKTRVSDDDFMTRVKAKHGDRYDYSKTVYTGSDRPITVTCKVHGDITQRADGLLRYGCDECSSDARKTPWEEFVKKAQDKHAGKYTYPRDDYDKSRDYVGIVCSKHGKFRQNGQDHLRGHGCPVCAASTGEKRIWDLLTELNIEFESEYKLPDSLYRYDFYLTELNIFIEYDEQHHFSTAQNITSQNIRENDLVKNQLAKSYNVPLIRISYTEFDNLDTYLPKRIREHVKYYRDGRYFKNFLEFYRHYNLPGGATPSQYQQYLY